MKSSSIIAGLFLYLILSAFPAWAVQAHGGTEGLVSHEIGHFLFVTGMGYLLFHLYRPKITGAGWPQFRCFVWLIIGWNIMTFTGHWMHEFVPPEQYIRSDGITISFSIRDVPDIIFFITRLDHLVLVPSFIFLLLALQKWSQAE